MVLADYNDKNYDYTKYWQGRDYENASEFIALEKLLPSFYDESKKVIDVGGGFGRLLPILKERFGVIYIFDYSKKLLETAEGNAGKLGIKITIVNGDVNEISSLVEERFDFVTMIRVSHHLEDLEKAFLQIREILNDKRVEEILNNCGFKIEKKLSVSNLRHPFFKKYIPFNILLLLEKSMQKLGAYIYFGPSIFYKVVKKD